MSDRVYVEDPAFMRRAGRRMTFALVLVLILTSFFTVGGIGLVVAGELPGLPFAIGGAVLQIAAIVLVVVTRRIHRTLDDRSVARASLLAARRTTVVVRRAVFVTLIALILYGIVRLVLGDPWSLLTAAVIGLGLLLLANGAKTMRAAQDRSLNPPTA